LLWEWV